MLLQLRLAALVLLPLSARGFAPEPRPPWPARAAAAVGAPLSPRRDVAARATSPDFDDDEPGELRWYILEVVNGQETWVQEAVENSIAAAGLEHLVDRLLVPVDRVAATYGKKVYQKEKILYPGYIYCHIRLNKPLWSAMVNSQKVINFIGVDEGFAKTNSKDIIPGVRGKITPMPLEDADVERMLAFTRQGQVDDETAGQFAVDDLVAILAGRLRGETGVVRRLIDGKLMVRVLGYGQSMDIVLEPSEVRKLTPVEIETAAPGSAIALASTMASAGSKATSERLIATAKAPSKVRVRERTGKSLGSDARASAIEERREVRRSRRAGDRDADGGDEGEDDPAESKRAGFRSYLDEMDGLEGGSSFDRGRTPLPEDDDEDDFLRQLLEMDLDGGGDPGPPAPPAASTSPPPVTAARRASSPGPPPSRAEPAADESTQSTVLDDEQFLDELFGGDGFADDAPAQ